MKLLPHLYQVCGNMYASHQNVYVIEAENSLILIDTGLGEKDLKIIQSEIDYWGLNHKKILHVLLTHEHYEHISNAAFWQKNGAKVIAHSSAAKNIELGGVHIGEYRYLDFGSVEDFTVDTTVEDASVIELDGVMIKTTHTPGHSDGSVLYEVTLDNQVVVFSGDAVLMTVLVHKAAFGWSGDLNYNVDQYIESMKKISGTKADILLPGHGEICMRKAEKMFTGAYLLARLNLDRDYSRRPVITQ